MICFRLPRRSELVVAQARATTAEVAKIQLSLKLAVADALRDEDAAAAVSGAAAAGASPPADTVDGDAAAAGEAGEAAGGLPAPAPERRPIPAALEDDADVLRRRWAVSELRHDSSFSLGCMVTGSHSTLPVK